MLLLVTDATVWCYVADNALGQIMHETHFRQLRQIVIIAR